MSHYLTARARREAGSNYELSPEDAGAELAAALCDWIGMTTGITTTCVRLVKLARECSDWQIITLNRTLTPAEEEREEEVTRLLESVARDLPTPDDGPWRLTVDGDPRGAVVRLLAPEHAEGGWDGLVVDR